MRGPAGNQFSLLYLNDLFPRVPCRQLHERHLPLGDYHQLFRDKCFLVEEHADAVHAGHGIWGW